MRHGDVAGLPCDDESFDKVTSVEAFYFWPDRVANVKEMRCVLKPGGLVVPRWRGARRYPSSERWLQGRHLRSQGD